MMAQLEKFIKEKGSLIDPKQKDYCELVQIKSRLENKRLKEGMIVEIGKILQKTKEEQAAPIQEIRTDINNLFEADRETKSKQEETHQAILEILKILRKIKGDLYGQKENQ